MGGYKMEAIRTIGISLCITVVATTLFSMLLPDGKMDKVVKFAISLFFLTGIISPFFSSELNFRIEVADIIPEQNRTQLVDTMDEQMISLAKVNLENSLERMLTLDGYSVRKIQVEINKSQTNNISISKLMVYIEEETAKSSLQIEKTIQKEVGITPSIVVLKE